MLYLSWIEESLHFRLLGSHYYPDLPQDWQSMLKKIMQEQVSRLQILIAVPVTYGLEPGQNETRSFGGAVSAPDNFSST
jgi:hypothetical protein